MRPHLRRWPLAVLALVTPVPSAAEHPRLLFSAADVASIRARADRPALAPLKARLLARAEAALDAPPILVSLTGRGEPDKPGEVKGIAAARELQGRVLTHCMAFTLTGDRRYRDAAVRELDHALLAWAIWVDTAHPPPYDLMTGENALTFGLAYDWLFRDLSPEERARIREGSERRALTPYLEGARKDPPMMWLRARHNWNTVCNGGATVLALALEGESRLEPEVLALSIDGMQRYWEELGDDGGWAEGTGYWTYGHRYAFIAAEALRRCGRGEGARVFGLPGARRTADFPLVFNPGRTISASFGDSNGRAHDAIFYLLGREYRRAEYVWFQDRAFERESRRDAWPQEALALLWRSTDEPWLPEAVAGFVPSIPSVAAFPSIGWALMAPSQPDPPFFLAIKNGSLAANHTHLDLNHVSVGMGERMLAVELGSRPYPADYFNAARRYQYYEISTPGHNTVLIGGRGQVHGRPGKLVGPVSGRGFEAVTGVADGAYEVEGVKARRHVVFVNRRYWVLLDEVEAPSAESLEIRFHTFGTVLGPTSGVWSLVQEGQALDIAVASDPPVPGRAQPADGWIRPVQVLSFRSSAEARSWVVATVLYPRQEADAPLAAPTLSGEARGLRLGVGADEVRFARGPDGFQLEGVFALSRRGDGAYNASRPGPASAAGLPGH
jgi:hypothetical protein